MLFPRQWGLCVPRVRIFLDFLPKVMLVIPKRASCKFTARIVILVHEIFFPQVLIQQSGSLLSLLVLKVVQSLERLFWQTVCVSAYHLLGASIEIRLHDVSVTQLSVRSRHG